MRSPRTRKAAIAQWRRNKKREGTWVTDPQRCAMTMPSGRRCPNESAGPFGYCQRCWTASNPTTS